MALRPVQLRDNSGRFQGKGDWFKVTSKGPIFDGTGVKAVRANTVRMSNTVARAAQRHVQTVGSRNFRYQASDPTHFFVNNVQVDRVADGHLVHADQVVYGPWLEGTSSRNVTSRFKGYQLFRRAAQETQRHLPKILSEDEMRMVRQLGGTGVRTGPVL